MIQYLRKKKVFLKGVLDVYNVNISELKAEMGRKGFNITSLSKQMGVCRETVSRVLKGENPTYPFMCKCIKALALSETEAMQIFFSKNLRKKKV